MFASGEICAEYPFKRELFTGGAMSDSTTPRSSTEANVGRRGLLKGVAGMAGLAPLSPALGACGSSGSGGGGGGGGGYNGITLGSHYSHPAAQHAVAALLCGAFKAADGMYGV